MLSLNEYQRQALRTRPTASTLELLNLSALGLTGEAGEFAEIVKKFLFHNHSLDIEKARKEVGDVLWYAAVAAYALDTTLEEIASGNIEKLRKRYPEGFDPTRSRERSE